MHRHSVGSLVTCVDVLALFRHLLRLPLTNFFERPQTTYLAKVHASIPLGPRPHIAYLSAEGSRDSLLDVVDVAYNRFSTHHFFELVPIDIKFNTIVL